VVRRVQLVHADFKYPLLRVEQTIAVDPVSGEEEVLSTREMVADHILVQLKDDSSVDDLQALNTKFGAKVRKKMSTPGLHVIAFAAPDIDTVQARIAAYNREAAVVQFAEPDYIVYASDTIPDDPRFQELWGLHNTGQSGGTADADIDAPEAWDLSTGDGSVVVGVIDTGVDHTHEDLADNMWTNPGEAPGNGEDDDGNGFVDDIHGWDFVNEDNDPFDDNRHGTHVSGTIAAVGNNGIGVVGVNWSARIMALKFLGSGGSGTTSDAIEAIAYATWMRQNGINVRLTNNSWGGGAFSQALRDAIAGSGDEGMLFVAAAGNEGTDNDLTPHYPSNYSLENIIAVAATDRNDQRASFSNFGSTTVDLGAPGVSIVSAVPGDAYDSFNGTSMATPHVSGVAAMVWNLNPSASDVDVRDAIFAGVDPIPAMDGVTLTAGRVNLFNTLLQLGMIVVGSSPAPGAIVTTAPTAFQVEFSNPYEPASIEASDLLVNGQAADAVTLTDSNTVSFQFFSAPVTVQGTQTLFIAEDEVSRADDGDGVREWNAVFRYDALRLEVVSSTPADGATVLLPLDAIRLDFNESIDPASVDASDLVLSHGTVTGVNVVAADTVEFLVTDINAEAVLSVALPADAITDTFGNPGIGFAASVVLDFGTVPYPQALQPVEPKGSLIYDPPVPARIDPASDIDAFTLDLDAGQLLTLRADPEDSLRLAIELRDPADAVLGQALSPVPGAQVVLPHLPIAAAGTYTIQVWGDGQTNGTYTLEALLNAVLEAEAHGGPANDTISTAEDLESGFLSIGGAERAAVLGRLQLVPFFTRDFDLGLQGFTINNTLGAGGGLWHHSTGRRSDGLEPHSPPGSLYYGQNENEFGNGNYNTGSAANEGVVFSPAIALPDQSVVVVDFNYFLATEGNPDWDIVEVAADAGAGFVPVLSSADGRLPTDSGGIWARATADLSAWAGQQVTLRFSFDTRDGIFNDEEGWYLDDLVLTSSTQIDWYRFSLMQGEIASLVLHVEPGKNADLQLCDATGAPLAFGTPADNVTKAIREFTAPSADTYYAKVSAGSGAYSLVVTRDMLFEVEPNDQAGTAQDLTLAGKVLGALPAPLAPITQETEPNDDGQPGASPNDLPLANDWSGSFNPVGSNAFEAELGGEIAAGSNADWDFFRIHAGPGDTLDVHMRGSPSGSGTLSDPFLRLYDRDADEIAANDDSGGLESFISFSGFTYTGAYYVVADSFGAAAGTYTLAATLTTTEPITFEDDDFYTFVANAGDVVSLTTETPGGDPLLFDNDLDPSLELLNPAGTVVASGSNGAPDGVNVSLVYTTASAGLHSARIFGSAGSAGEYALSVDGHTGNRSADLAVSLNATPSDIHVGCLLHVNVSVVNNGPHPANGIALTHTFPEGLQWLSTTATVGTCSGSGPVECALGTLAPGESASVTIVHRPLLEGTFTTTVEAVSADADPVPGNNHLAITTPVAGAVAPPGGPVTAVPGTPLVSGDPLEPDQNHPADNFDLNPSGGAAVGVMQCGFGHFGNVYVNFDSTNLYIGGTALDVTDVQSGAILFVGLNTVSNDALTLTGKSGQPLGLDLLHNVQFTTPMDLAILLGDEFGDGTFPEFKLGDNATDLGQGMFYLGATNFPAIPGAQLSQFDGSGTTPTASADDDGNRLTDRWEACIPWSALDATGMIAVSSLRIAGVIVGGSSGSDRFLSGNYLGASIAADAGLDAFNNFGFSPVTLTGLDIRLPDTDGDGLPDWWEALNGLDPNDGGGGDAAQAANGDLDGDAASNLHEFMAGTDPNDMNSQFATTRFLGDGAELFQITVATEPGKRYSVQFSDTALTENPAWTSFANPANGVGTWTESGSGPSTFTFIDDFSGNTSGAPPTNGFRVYRVLAEDE